MTKEIRPKDFNPNFDFNFNEIVGVELEDWPIEEFKKVTNWDIAVKEFNKHVDYLCDITFGSPFPINSFSIGAAELKDYIVQIRLFLFSHKKPTHQEQSIGQIICEFQLNSDSSNIKVWPDFLEFSEFASDEIKETVLIQMSRRFIDKLKKNNTDKLHILENQQQINQLRLSKSVEDSSQMFHLSDVGDVVRFIKEKINNGLQIAILYIGEDKVALITGNDIL
jgi:hypothetical protein